MALPLDLYREIRETPLEAGVYRVSADWLEERGDPRGEFIRLQLELENMELPQRRRRALLTRANKILYSRDSDDAPVLRDIWISDDMAALVALSEEEAFPEIHLLLRGFVTQHLGFSRGILDIVPMEWVDILTIREIAFLTDDFGGEFNRRIAVPRVVRQQQEEGEQERPLNVQEAILHTMLHKYAEEYLELQEYEHPLRRIVFEYFRDNKPSMLQILLDAGCSIDPQLLRDMIIRTSPRIRAEQALAEQRLEPEEREEIETMLNQLPRLGDLIAEARLLVRNGTNPEDRQAGMTIKDQARLEHGEDSPFYKALVEEEALYRKNQSLKDRIPSKGSGFSQGRGGSVSKDV